MKKYSLAIVCGLSFVGLVHCQMAPTKDSPSSARHPSAADRSDNQGPIDDCLDHSYLYARYDGLDSECTINYVHYFPHQAVVPAPPKEKIHIGSFNLLHLGDNQSAMKNFTLVAQIMNQWDIVAAQELMPLPTEQAISNHAIRGMIEKKGADNDFYNHNFQVERPGYLNLLKRLRDQDPSWSLILQPMAEGEGSSGEMAGFYYRSSVVQLREWNYCPVERAMDLKSQRPVRNLGCLVQLPEAQQKLVSRRAFTAYFQSGSFNFVGLTAHVRFRADDSADDLKQQALEVCQNYSTAGKCKPTKDDVGRFYEVLAIAGQVSNIQRIAQTNKVIYMGDYNLEYNDNTQEYWKSALHAATGFEVYQHQPTTLAVQKASLLSNYDHFIFNASDTAECNPASAQPYDDTVTDTPPTPLQSTILAAIDPANVAVQINTRMAEINNFAKAKITKNNEVSVVNLDPKEIQEYKDRFQDTTVRMKTNKFGALLELISDHVPIQLECQTNGAKK